MCLLSLFCKYISQSEINITIVIETKRNQDTALIKKWQILTMKMLQGDEQ